METTIFERWRREHDTLHLDLEGRIANLERGDKQNSQSIESVSRKIDELSRWATRQVIGTAGAIILVLVQVIVLLYHMQTEHWSK